jgi:hypothetical protein
LSGAGDSTHWKDVAGKYGVQKEEVWKQAQDWALQQKFTSTPEQTRKYFANAYVPKS